VWGHWFKDVLKTNTASVLYPDLPPVARDLGVFIKLAKGQGLDVKGTPYPPNGTDLTSAIAAANVNSTGATLLVTATAASCIAAAKGLKSAGATKPVSALGFCTDPAVKAGLGGYPDNWTILSWYDNVNAPEADPSGGVAAYVQAMKEYGKESETDTNLAPFGFIATLTAVKFLNQAGGPDATPAGIAAKADAYEGPIFMGPPVQSWKKAPADGIGRAAGLLTSRLYTFKDGKWTDPAGGWIYADGVKPAPDSL
jgi:hypothetical protein